MARRRVVKSVLHNFLGTYTSRYSDFNGYWLFGFLVEDIGSAHIDLLDTSVNRNDITAWDHARHIATQKFAEQVVKAELPLSWFRDVSLNIVRGSEYRSGVVNGHTCLGFTVEFSARAVMDTGALYTATRALFLIPHDPRIELRSVRTP